MYDDDVTSSLTTQR